MAIKFTFTLDDDDLKYFHRLLRDAKKYARDREASEIMGSARSVVSQARKSPRLPQFAVEAIDTLEALVDMVEDKDFAIPKNIGDRVIAALAYFAQPDDLIPDHIPGLGFLDDAIMIKIVEDEFQFDLWGYRKFCRFRAGAEQRPWTGVAQDRLPGRLKKKRDEIRDQIAVKKEKQEARAGRRLLGW